MAIQAKKLSCYFVLLATWVAFIVIVFDYSYHFYLLDSGWHTGEWLINYYSGFIRRGLLGSILLLISEFGISLRLLSHLAQIFFFGVVYWLALKLYCLRDRDYVWLIFLFSPAYILYPLYDLQGGFRKEIIVYSIFLLLCVNYSRRKFKPADFAIYTSFFLMAAFTHELTFFTLPFFFYVFLRMLQEGIINKNYFYTLITIFTTVSAVAIIIAYLFKGDPQMASQICETITQRGIDAKACQGSISWLDKDNGYGFNIFDIKIIGYILFHFLALTVSLLPILLVTERRLESNKNFYTFIHFNGLFAIILAIGFLFILPLFYFAVDWGRWVQIYVFFTFTLVLAESNIKLFNIQPIPILPLILYLTLWNIPHCCGYWFGYGFAGKLITTTVGIEQKYLRNKIEAPAYAGSRK